MKRYMTQENQRHNSISEILRYIVEHKAATRREIERETGFSWGSVSEISAQLLESGYITEEKDTRKTGAGRTGYILKPRGDKIASVGIDVNRTALSAQVVGFDGAVKHSVSKPFECVTQRQVLSAAIELCEEMLVFCGDKLRVMCIGVAFQGLLDRANGVSVRFPIEGDWIACSIKQIFEDRFGIYTYLEHDPKCMLIAKSAESREREKSLMLVRIDGGIGMSVMQDGRILDDTEKLELGHMLAVYHGLECSCGRRGCLEAYASIDGISRRCQKSFDELLKSKEKYKEVFDEAAYHLGVALHNAAMLFYPERMILTGKFTHYAAAELEILDKIKEIFYELEEYEGRRKIDITVEENISAAYGAAINAVNSAINNYQF